MPRLRQAEERTEDAATAAKQLGNAQDTYKREFDARTKEKTTRLRPGIGFIWMPTPVIQKSLGVKPKDPTWYYKPMGIGLWWRALGVFEQGAVTKSLVTTGAGCEMDPGP